MKTAIIFKSKHGTTKKVAQLISQKLSNEEVYLFDLSDHPRIDLSVFDILIVGASVHAKKLDKQIKKFLQLNTLMLLEKKLALFMCALEEKEYLTNFNTEFPELLREHAFSKQIVGGELLFDKMNLIEAFITRKVSGQRVSFSRIDYRAVDQLVIDIKKHIN